MAKKKRAVVQPQTSRTPDQLVDALIDVEGLMSGKHWAEALQRLQALHQRYPRRRDVLTLLAEVQQELEDWPAYLSAVEQLNALVPNDPDLTLALGGAYMVALYPFLALRTMRTFRERWPEHPEAEKVRETIADLEKATGQILAEGRVTGPDAEEIFLAHEEARRLMDRGELRQARGAAERLLRLHPDFVPVLNNLSMIYQLEGRLDEAIATAQRVLAREPENVFALANLIIYEFRSGQIDEAREATTRLVALQPQRDDAWAKMAEALSYIGDDQGVLEVYRRAERADALEEPSTGALLEHLTAVAWLRQGKSSEARRHWEKALALDPAFTLAATNLADLEKPVGERHGPWAFPMENWLPVPVIEELRRVAGQRGAERLISTSVRRSLREHPEITRLAPFLFDRGDPLTTEFLMLLASATKNPELLAATRDFALSQRGSDQQRTRAFHQAQEAGLLPRESVRLWREGKWIETMPLNFEITREPKGALHHSQKVQDLAADASLALNEGDGKQGERLLKEALQDEPDAPDLLNNLAAAYTVQGRRDEARQLQLRLFQEHPDYFFARIGMARIDIEEGRLAEARKLLEPLIAQETFHISEFAALCAAEAEILLAEGEPASARTWVDLLASIEPDHPSVLALRQMMR